MAVAMAVATALAKALAKAEGAEGRWWRRRGWRW